MEELVEVADEFAKLLEGVEGRRGRGERPVLEELVEVADEFAIRTVPGLVPAGLTWGSRGREEFVEIADEFAIRTVPGLVPAGAVHVEDRGDVDGDDEGVDGGLPRREPVGGLDHGLPRV